MRFLIHWAIVAAALWLAAHLVPGVIIRSVPALLIAALVLGLVNALVRPVLTILTLPITVLTLGLFYLVVNGAAFALAAALVPGFDLAGPELDEALDLAARLAAAADAGRVDLNDLGRRARRLLASTTESSSA